MPPLLTFKLFKDNETSVHVGLACGMYRSFIVHQLCYGGPMLTSMKRNWQRSLALNIYSSNNFSMWTNAWPMAFALVCLARISM